MTTSTPAFKPWLLVPLLGSFHSPSFSLCRVLCQGQFLSYLEAKPQARSFISLLNACCVSSLCTVETARAELTLLQLLLIVKLSYAVFHDNLLWHFTFLFVYL